MKGMLALTKMGELILLLLGTLIMILFISELGGKIGCYDKMACQVSAVANSKARDPITQSQVWKLKCPTQYVRFTKEGYIQEVNDCNHKVKFKKDIRSCKLGSGKCPYLDDVNKVIAQKIFDCWEQFGAGQISLFSNYDVSRQCVICTVIEFDEDVKSTFGDVYDYDILPTPEESQSNEDLSMNLDEYMRNNGPIGRDITYYEYTEDAYDHFQKPYYGYNFQKTYAVVFTAMNEYYLTNLAGDAWNVIKQVPGAILSSKSIQFGSEKEERYVNLLHFIETDFVDQECDRLAAQ